MVLAKPVPANGVAGVDVPAAFWNAQVRDAVTYLLGPPLFKGTTSVAVSIPNGAFTPLALNTNTVDTYSGHSTVTNPSRYVSQISAWYWVSGGAQWAASNAGLRDAELAVNGTALPETAQAGLNSGTGVTSTCGPYPSPVFLNAGDYVELWVFQNSGAALNVATGFLSALACHG